MTEEDKTITNPEDTETPELNLEEVVEVDPAEATDEQKAFLEEHKDELTSEQAEKFGIKLEEEETEPEVRGETKKKEEEADEEDQEEDEISPEDEKTIGKIVDKRVGDKLSQIQKIQDESEVDAFIRAKPEYGKYRNSMLKYMSHEAYKNIPVHNIAAIVSARDLQKIGAQKEREAQRKANETKGGGSTVRKPGGAVDWRTAPKEEFEAQKAKVLGQQVS